MHDIYIYISPLLVQQLQHMGKHFPLPLLTPCAICTLSNLHTNAVCVLVYIPSLVGGLLYWLPYSESSV